MAGPKIKGTLDIRDRVIKRIHVNKLWDAILEGKANAVNEVVQAAAATEDEFVEVNDAA